MPENTIHQQIYYWCNAGDHMISTVGACSSEHKSNITNTVCSLCMHNNCNRILEITHLHLYLVIYHATTWITLLSLTCFIFLCGIHSLNWKKYFGNPYAYAEISLNKPRNTLNYVCDLDSFSKIQSQLLLSHDYMSTAALWSSQT